MATDTFCFWNVKALLVWKPCSFRMAPTSESTYMSLCLALLGLWNRDFDVSQRLYYLFLLPDRTASTRGPHSVEERTYQETHKKSSCFCKRGLLSTQLARKTTSPQHRCDQCQRSINSHEEKAQDTDEVPSRPCVTTV